MTDINRDRREFIKDTGALAAGVALATTLPGVAGAQPASPAGEFDIDKTFADFMQDLGRIHPMAEARYVHGQGSDPAQPFPYRVMYGHSGDGRRRRRGGDLEGTDG